MYVKYKTHIQNIGDSEYSTDGATSGTTGKALRLESVAIEICDNPNLEVVYRSHVQNIGWQKVVQNGAWSGTIGKALSIEAVQIELNGPDASKYSIWYRVHAQNYGWMNWVKDGASSGSEGYSLRVEAIQIMVLPKGVELTTNSTLTNKTYTPKKNTPAVDSFGNKYDMSGIKVFVAWGHGIQTDGTPDCGCTDGDWTEENLMGPIAKQMVARLRSWGCDVGSDVDTGNDRNCTYTIRDANDWGCDAYIALHCDYNQAPSGTLPICYPGSDAGCRLASCLDAAVRARIGIGSRGISQRDDLMEVADTDAPACIFETGSIRADINILVNQAGLYGDALACGVGDYFGRLK